MEVLFVFLCRLHKKTFKMEEQMAGFTPVEYGQPSVVKAVRGITIIEELDLNKLSKSYFEPIAEFEHRKFGWFSCFGGQIRLTLNMDRSAFVCGEGMTIVGRIENKSDRHIEKVSACLQRIIRFGTEIDESNETPLTDIQEMQEDFLAMSIEGGSCIKIDKKINIPPLVPSTPFRDLQRRDHRDEHGNRFNLRRRSLAVARRSSMTNQRSRTSLSSPSQIQRLMAVSYKYMIIVKSGGDDVIVINVPVIIGSKPLIDTMGADNQTTRDMSGSAVYRLCKHDRAISLLDSKERTLCNKAQLQHLNMYPFYSELSTSSKQSKKLGTIATTIRAENKVVNTLLHTMVEDHHERSTSDCNAVTAFDSPHIIDTERAPTSANI
ncbi:unnamed protein product [Angiostrongylus costaricensis]|uniref:Arrestin_C domain-containing protein n=1 Tax=Angiostrongylus costaricensis TaxID=334426 RepID=A0A0R3PE65_ANGCS|nr:unnamed protein product [Angiostrongylus costaricensis]